MYLSHVLYFFKFMSQISYGISIYSKKKTTYKLYGTTNMSVKLHALRYYYSHGRTVYYLLIVLDK